MPLSEHEQRLLEQIEQALYAEDPKFAQTWRVRDLRSLRRARALRAGALVFVGLGLLVAGVVIQGGNTVVGVVLGVVGFLAMLGGAWFAMAGRQRQPRPANGPGRAVARGPRESVKSRLEQRWQRRQDNR
ncbi:MAG: DUF3040 domain-containing protein [Frankiales bacterium]|nr:DUF3040 domain-containing protein [Frankiales bacterium]